MGVRIGISFSFITKCDKCDYKVRQVLQSVTILLQRATFITKCDSTLCNTYRTLSEQLSHFVITDHRTL